MEGQKWSQLQTAQVVEGPAHPAAIGGDMQIKTDGKWIARLFDKQGDHIRTIEVPWPMSPKQVPFFLDLGNGVMQYPADGPIKVERMFIRRRVVRSDRFLIIEYREGMEYEQSF